MAHASLARCGEEDWNSVAEAISTRNQADSSEHAGNAGMLQAIGVTHVVSVGESLITCPPDCDPMYGPMNNTLCSAARAGTIKV